MILTPRIERFAGWSYYMLIKTIQVEGFRSIRNETLECDPLTALVGPNGAGKSAFLQALRVFYDVAARITLEDFFNRDQGQPIIIRVTYGDLRAQEREEFHSYMRGDTLTVTKRITWTDGRAEQKYYGSAMQFPPFGTVRAARNKTDQIAQWNELVAAGSIPGVVDRAKRGQDIDALMANFDASHPDLLRPDDKEEQFFGPRNVGGGKLDNYTKFVHLPAVRDVSDETGEARTSSLYQLLDTLVLRRLQSRPEVLRFKEEFAGRLREIYKPENLAGLADLAAGISRTLSEFVPGATFQLEFGEVKVPDLPAPPTIPTVTEDEFAGDVARKGHGLQRALIFTLLQHLAVLQRPEEGRHAPDGNAEVAPAPAQGADPELILAIDEPELYQHPQRCRYLARLLLDLTRDPRRGLGARNQVIYTTHSPYFVSLDRFEQIRLARKRRPDPASPPATQITSFTLADAARRVAEIAGGEEGEFDADRFRARAYPIMTVTASEGFFANTVAIVEGQTESGMLWKVSEIPNKEWVRRGIVVIPAEGKDALDKPVIIFSGLRIPTYFVFDADGSHRGQRQQGSTVVKNHRCLRLAGAPEIADFPPTTIQPNWACFEDKIEIYCEQTLGTELFREHRAAVAEDIGYDEPSRVLKNFDGACSFVEKVYSAGGRLPVLEEIVNGITALAP
ncbi:MAG: AAA family ATPase [Chloroflexota bacterium]|nr:AAA family ATPase [Chloroflexota bacterium]